MLSRHQVLDRLAVRLRLLGRDPTSHPFLSLEPIRLPSRANVLATFKIPIGLSEAELIFTGEKLVPEDFDALADYVGLFKKQYLRKQQAVAQEAQITRDAQELQRELMAKAEPPA